MTSGSLGLLQRQNPRSLEWAGRLDPALGGWSWVLCACCMGLGTSGPGQGDMAEAAGVFGGRAGSRAPSSPRHLVNNTVSPPRAALCTRGSAPSCSQPGSTATPAPGTRGRSFAGRHEPAVGGGRQKNGPH